MKPSIGVAALSLLTLSTAVVAQSSRTEVIEYHDNLDKWVVGQVAVVRCVAPSSCITAEAPGGIEIARRTFTPGHAQIASESFHGRPASMFAWNTAAGDQAGTMQSMTDGRGAQTLFSDWHRGVPQSIRFPSTPEAPAGAEIVAEVDDHGRITHVVDEVGARTCYAYDSMGRVSGVAHPRRSAPGTCDFAGTEWATTTVSYAQQGVAAYGIPAGHWRREANTGSARTVTHYDAMWRPVIEERFDTHDRAGKLRQLVRRYDAMGRQSFVSYPQRTDVGAVTSTWGNPGVVPTAAGTRTEYDVLDRVTAVRQDSELGVLATTIAHLPGFVQRVTSPKNQGTGVHTDTHFLAWDTPSTDFPVKVVQPLGTETRLSRDAFGKLDRPEFRRHSGPV